MVRQSGKKRRLEETGIDYNPVPKKRKLNAANLTSSALDPKLHADLDTQIAYEVKQANHDLISDRDIDVGCDIIEPICDQECLAYIERNGHLERIKEDTRCEGAINLVLECGCQEFEACWCYGSEVNQYFNDYVHYLKVRTRMWNQVYWGITKKIELKVEQGQILSYNNDDNHINESLAMIGLGESRCDICDKRYGQCVCDDFKAIFFFWH